jgi:hypothetical protein
MKRKNNLPTGVYKQGNRFRSQVNIYHNRKGKYIVFSCSSYETAEQAAHARQLIIDLIGTTDDTKKKVRPWKVRETVNEYRKTLGLTPLKEKDR